MLLQIKVVVPLRLDEETGVILLSDTDSHEQAVMKVINGQVHFFSKKLKKWIPVQGECTTFDY
jgi:hypothetical protein